MKKVFLSLIIIFMVLSLSVVLVKAEVETTVELRDEISVRTDANVGIMWEGTVTNPQAGQTYGFLFAQGEVKNLSIETADVVNVEITELLEENKFRATMVKFPKAAVAQDISVRTYVKTGDVYAYSEYVDVRNLAETVLYAKNKGLDGTGLNNVVTYLEQNYKKAYTSIYGIPHIDSSIYESNYKYLAEAFIYDWNECFESELSAETAFVVSSYASPFRTAATATKIADSNLYKFFNTAKYKEKWGWLFTYLLAETDASTATWGYPNGQATAIINGDTSLSDTNWSNGNHITSYILSFFNGQYASTGYSGYRFENNRVKLSNVYKYNTKIYANLSSVELVKIGESTTLANQIAPAAGYSWNGWTDGTSIFAENSEYEVTNNNTILTPTYKPIEYTISYFDEEEEIAVLSGNTYSIESLEIVLPTYEKNNYEFLGWYLDPEFTQPVTSIPAGSTGNKVFYAKTEEITGYTINYVLNNGITTYTTKQEVVNDLFADLNTYFKKEYTPSNLGVLSSPWSVQGLYTFFQDNTYNEKWTWLMDFFADTETNSYNKFAFQYLIGEKTSGWSDDSHKYSVEYVLAAFANNDQYRRNIPYLTADYSLDVNNKFWSYFDTNESEVEINCMGEKTLNTKIYRDGYTFGGWYTTNTFEEESKVSSVSSATTVYAKWNKITASDAETTVVLAEQDLNVITLCSPTIFVNSTFTEGTYIINGVEHVYGETAFNNLREAMPLISSNDKVYVFAGQYTDDTLVYAAQIQILGPNYNISGTSSRYEEATFKSISIGASNITINGIKTTNPEGIIINASQNITIVNCVITGAATAETQSLIKIAGKVTGLIIENNLINSTNNTVNYHRGIFGGDSYVVTNATIQNNTIVNDAPNSIYTDAIRFNNIAGNIIVKNNNIDWGGGNYTIFFGSKKIAENTTIDILGNTLDMTNKGSGLSIRNATATSVINIKNNSFDNVSGTMIQVRGSGSSDTTTTATVNICNNALLNLSTNISIQVSATNVVLSNNYFFQAPNFTSVSVTNGNPAASAEDALSGE